jgi:hypothetical protein
MFIFISEFFLSKSWFKGFSKKIPLTNYWVFSKLFETFYTIYLTVLCSINIFSMLIIKALLASFYFSNFLLLFLSDMIIFFSKLTRTCLARSCYDFNLLRFLFEFMMPVVFYKIQSFNLWKNRTLNSRCVLFSQRAI